MTVGPSGSCAEKKPICRTVSREKIIYIPSVWLNEEIWALVPSVKFSHVVFKIKKLFSYFILVSILRCHIQSSILIIPFLIPIASEFYIKICKIYWFYLKWKIFFNISAQYVSPFLPYLLSAVSQAICLASLQSAGLQSYCANCSLKTVTSKVMDGATFVFT